jgi:LmbE family N-acetylglucosaminyl deacetylase
MTKNKAHKIAKKAAKAQKSHKIQKVEKVQKTPKKSVLIQQTQQKQEKQEIHQRQLTREKPHKRQLHAAKSKLGMPKLGQIFKKLPQASFPNVFALFAVTILAASTVVWSTLGALVNQGNADQLVNSYLFENAHTFQEAVFPSQHSFLLKWPLFWIIRLFHFSNGAFITITVLAALVTVAALAWIIHKLERRPMYFGALCLALASALLLVPAQPYAGGLLPVNMAMTTTRNLEYVAYLAILAYASRWYRVKNWRFWLVVAALALLVASDKLFASLAIGGAAVSVVVYWLAKRKHLLQRAGPWLVATIVSTVLATGIIGLLNAAGVTHILNTPGAAPYAISLNPHNLVLGAFYAVAGIFTNFGGNPAFDATTLKGIPHIVFRHLYSPAGLAYITNAVIVVAGLVAAGHIGHRALSFKTFRVAVSKGKRKKQHDSDLGRAYFVALALIWSSLAATAAFIVTSHAYIVDSRYVSIWLFTLFICLATYGRSRTWPLPRIAGVCGILVITIIGGSWGAFQNYYSEKNALSGVTARNHDVAQVLQQRKSTLLVGDYWRVLPIKATATMPLTTLPLSDCTKPREVLTSKAWQPDLHTHGFAYLLTLDKGLTDFPPCTLQQIIGVYGQPNSSVVIDGKLTKPNEIVLFYDHGIGRIPHRKDDLARAVTSILPVTLDKLTERRTKCSGQPTIMNIVAHEDDDLLFMNPDLGHDIAAGHCVRTVYLTAGDAGSDSFYWIGREHGSEAAYDAMDGPMPDAWRQQNVDLNVSGQNQYVTIASPRQNDNISLIFVHLPDGGLQGGGFRRSHNVSLERLHNGSITSLQTVDGQSTYSSDSLTQSLAALIRTYQPTEIRTQADDTSADFPDHSDHRAVSRLVSQAKQLYTDEIGADIPLTYYMGYPVRDLDENVSDSDLEQKQAAFFAYAKFDHGVCQSIEDCSYVPAYYGYLHRQYKYFP